MCLFSELICSPPACIGANIHLVMGRLTLTAGELISPDLQNVAYMTKHATEGLGGRPITERLEGRGRDNHISFGTNGCLSLFCDQRNFVGLDLVIFYS